MNTKNTRGDEELRESFRCIVSLAHAKPVNSKTTCVAYKPEIDEYRTPDQDAQAWSTSVRVRQYLQSWVIPFLEEHLGFSEQDVLDAMVGQHDAITHTKATQP